MMNSNPMHPGTNFGGPMQSDANSGSGFLMDIIRFLAVVGLLSIFGVGIYAGLVIASML